MLDKILQISIRNRPAALLLAAVIAAWGYYAFGRLRFEAFPDPTDPEVQVIALFPGKPAEEVERRLSIPLERALAGTPGLVRVRTASLYGLSFVTLIFDEATDLSHARHEITSRVAAAALPEGARATLGPAATPIGEVYRYTLDGRAVDPMALRTIQDFTVRPALRVVPGVADVVSVGGLIREIHVEPDPARMAALGITLDHIVDALRKAGADATGGHVERGAESLLVRSLGVLRSMAEIEAVRVGSQGGVPVTVRDVCAVKEGYTQRQGVVTRDDDEDAVEGIVLVRRGENPGEVLAALDRKIDALNDRLRPEGVAVRAFYDRKDLFHTALSTVFDNLTLGAVLVTLVLFAFMLSLRASLIVALVIPLSLAVSFIYLSVRGISANLLSMGAVNFGIIVSGAVILVEHVFHKVSPPAGKSAAPLPSGRLGDRIFLAARGVARPTLFSLLIIIAAYVPIFALERAPGRIFSPLASAVVAALIGALLLSFTLVPVLCFFALRWPRPQSESPVLAWARRAYDPALAFAMRHPATILVGAVGALISAATILPRLGSEFLPELNEGALYVTFALPADTSLTEGRRLTPRIKELLRRTPEVTGLLTQLGRPEDGTDPKLPNNLEVFVKLEPLERWRAGMRQIEDLVAEMTTNLQEIPGLEFNFSQPIRDNVDENISGQKGQIALKIYGDDLEVLQPAAEAARREIARVGGAADVGLVKSAGAPQIHVKPDRAALARLDLDLDDVQGTIETAMGGRAVAELWQGDRRLDVVVRYPPDARGDGSALRRLMIPRKDGSTIPLAAIADVSIGSGRAAITREDGRRYVGVRMNVRRRDLGSFVEEARARVAAAVHLPAGYDMTWGGEFENQERATRRLGLVIPIALGVAFILLFSAFGSLFDAGVIVVSVPFALIGGVLGLGLARMTLSTSAAVGFIVLLGQAVLNGVLVVASIRGRIDAGQRLYDAVVSGARDRLRAVLMTALLASLGLLPAAMSRAIGSEVERPIAVVTAAGTLSAAAVTLIVLPVTYYLACVARERLVGRASAVGAPS